MNVEISSYLNAVKDKVSVQATSHILLQTEKAASLN